MCMTFSNFLISHLSLSIRFVGGGDSRGAVQEIARQLKYVKFAKLYGLTDIEPEDEFTWNLMMRGPSNSPFKKGLFSITIRFPTDYPYGAPSIIFNTPIFHPNVFSDGQLCWHANDTNGSTYFADALISAINILLVDPNPNSPANREAAELFNRNKQEYNRQAAQHTSRHAWFK